MSSSPSPKAAPSSPPSPAGPGRDSGKPAGGVAARGGLPGAVLRDERRLSAIWLVPMLALALAGWLGFRAWSQRGVFVTVHLAEGHGLKPGDAVRYRGITVGEVRRVELAEGLEGIVVTAGLRRQADELARGGSRFWVVRPQVGPGGVAGLETLLGPRYMEVLPGNGGRQHRFIGLAEPPAVERIEPGDLEVILEANQRGGLRAGAPVTYRQVRVGTVLSVGLTTDGGAVEARLHIQQAYVQLIREDTLFWESSGIEARIGLGGLTLGMNSLETMLSGGVGLATPPGASEVVRTGHRFTLVPHGPDDEWLEWQPMALIGSAFLPPGAPMPNPLRAKLAWRQGKWISRERSRQGWVLQTAEGLLGPADLLTPGEKAEGGTVFLEVAGNGLPLVDDPAWSRGGLAAFAAFVTRTTWPAQRRRVAVKPEDCIAVGDPAATPLPLAAARLSMEAGFWLVDPAVPLDESWHGACVLSRRDGYLVGMVLANDGEPVRVALLPEAPAAAAEANAETVKPGN